MLNFSDALLSKNDADQVIKLLKSKLVNMDNEDLANKNIYTDIGNCYHNLGIAYFNKADYQSAKNTIELLFYKLLNI
ncbi:hypothetical protein A1C_06645 [Rickettsia akari str. Hartford]|uniref:Tetratricopeptide repeat-containing protein n=1 Tax=Rickettsia akari (strain Hartford) TaxID=293614 RepID=A8GQ77_RICAH|nr:hypothetical protein [Rickettsia akari]ABV75552.1 hypothetical protein A1C_06645 [Rickettsia akari str. Hartford]